MGEKMKKLLFFLLLFICVSLGCVYGYLLVSNNKLETKINNYNNQARTIEEQSKNQESVIDSKKQSLADEKAKYEDLYKEYELWQKMNQSVQEQM